MVSKSECRSLDPIVSSIRGRIDKIIIKLGFSIRKFLVLVQSLEIGGVSTPYLGEQVKPSVLRHAFLSGRVRSVIIYRNMRESAFVFAHTLVHCNIKICPALMNNLRQRLTAMSLGRILWQ